MMKMTKRRIRRLLTVPCLLLALCLTLSVTALAVNEVDDQGEVPKTALTVKPVVTIQGNVVVDNGKPTGYYELALCVRSARTIVDNATGLEVSESFYANDVAADPDNAAHYTVTYYPFSAAAATVGVNTDVLTAVNWDVTEVTYAAWDATNGYAANDTSYPRGIDVSANTDPEVWMGTDPDPFPDVTTARGGLHGNPVALDAEGDRSMFTATGQVDDYYESDVTGTKTAIVTLSAHAPDNKPVVFTTNTPVAVVRFSYDLKRFNKTAVSEDYNNLHTDHDITGDAGDVGGFWLGFDRADNSLVATGSKTPLTWLADTAMGTGGNSFDFSDSKAATTEMGQVVWTKIGVANDAAGGWDETEYYYYLGAEGYSKYPGYKTIQVNVNGEPTAVSGVALPMTEGAKVLTPGSAQNDTSSGAPAEYTYFENLLRLGDSTLRLKMVNEPTFKKPTGISGPQILFYDWDDTLIGAMVVGKGDVRAQVNAYVEKNMVHPDLRTGDILQNELADTLPDLTTVTAATSAADGAAERYKAITDSLDREWTYRGKYSSKVDGSGVVRDENDPEPGKEYPLTNKLDYAFYRHLDTVTTLEYQSGGKTTTDRYITSEAVSSNADAALYPWVYGWAIVEDNSARNQSQWTVRRDAAQVENVWTTFGVGELSNLDPSYDMAGNPGVQVLPTTLPGTAVPGTSVGGGTGIETAYPAFIDPADVAAPPTDYAYQLSSAGDNGYLRFADFSNVNALLTRPGQNVIIVKAVYEPGTDLTGGSYQIIADPYYNKLNGNAANAGGAYSAELTVERANTSSPDGLLRGCRRIREPAVRQDTTIDQKWIEDSVMGVKNDLSNPSIEIAANRTQTTYTRVDTDNGEEITFTLVLSARQNKINYFLTEMYGANFVGGDQRTNTNFNISGSSHVIDNYNYMAEDSAQNDAFYDQQGVYYEAARFAVRNGSHGYVLYGTLNYLMEQATRVAQGRMTSLDFNAICAYAELLDTNLCFDGGTTLPAASTQTRFRNAILAAAQECVDNHQGDPDYWNNELDCAELTYHQLQHYLTSGTLMSRAAADAITIDWCHLHAACFKDPEAAAAPKDWNDIVTFAADPSKADGIGLLTGGISGKVEELTFLRATSNGDPFPAGSAFQAKIVEAVGKLNAAGQPLTWVNIQYYIVEGLTPTGNQGLNRALSNYWWYDGATSKPSAPNNLVALAAGAKAYTSGATLKDGSTIAGWRFGLAGLTDVFLDNDGRAPGVVAPAWIRITENLVAERVVNGPDDESTVKFLTYTDFETALLDAMDTADKAGIDPAADDLYWHKLQYHIFHKDEPGYSFPSWAASGDGSPQTTEMEGYWWHNGGKLYVVKDLQSMLEVARLAIVDGDADAAKAWDKFTSFSNSAGDPILELQFSKDFTGSMYTDADIAAFKAEIEAMVALPDAPTLSVADAADTTMKNATWRLIQYYLIHPTAANRLDIAEASIESNTGYYWWKDGGSPTAPGIDKWQDAFTAAFLEQVNGNTLAWDNLNTNAMLMRLSRLRNYDAANPPADPIYEYSKLPLFTTAEPLKDAAKAYVKQKINENIAADPTGHYHTVPVPTWFELQHYMVNGSWDVSGLTDLETRYWWYGGATEDPNKPVEAPDKVLKDWIAKYASSKADITQAAITMAVLKEEGIEFKSNLKGTNPLAATAKTMATNLAALWDAAEANGTHLADLTWYQLQIGMITTANGGTQGGYVDAATARTMYLSKVTKECRPQWLIDMEAAAGASLLALDMQEVAPEVTEAAAPETVEDIQARIEAMERELEALKEQLAALEETSEKMVMPAETPEVKPASTPAKPAAPVEQEPTTPEPETPGQVELTPAEPVTPAETETTPTPAPSYGEREETPMGEEAARHTVTVPATAAASPSPTLAMLEYKRYLNWLVRA